MKKMCLWMLVLAMIVSLVPSMVFSASAVDLPSEWMTYRSPSHYKEAAPGEEVTYTPAPGYEYTDEGFHMISADYNGTTPYGTFQTIDKVSVRDGVYMKLRIDQYPYGGEKGTADHWITFSIWDKQNVAPGNTKSEDGYGEGWLGLCRTPGGGKQGVVQSFVQLYSPTGSLGQGEARITPELDENGKEIYTFEVKYDGTNYSLFVCGVSVPAAALTEHLNELNADGEFYIGVTFHSGVANANIEATLLAYGTSAANAETPKGSDAKEPEENVLVIAPMADASTVPANTPCLLLDATASSCSNNFATQDMKLTPQGNNSFKVEPYAKVGFHMWSIKKSLSYEAKDFPVVAFLIEDPNQIVMSGSIRYATGENMSVDDVHIINYSVYDENCTFYGTKKEYIMVVLDMRELLSAEAYEEGWDGRIHGLRIEYSDLYLNTPIDPENDYFYFHYAGIFRSVEEAQAYQDAYMVQSNISEAPVDTEATTEVTTDATIVEGTDAVTESATEGQNDASNDQEVTTNASGDAQGCNSVIGMSTGVVLIALAATVVLKRKD